MKKLLSSVLVAIAVVSFTVFYGRSIDVFETPPVHKKWRVAYYEGGPYLDYNRIFLGTMKGLIKSGHVNSVRLPEPEGERTDALWHWASSHIESNKLEFVDDAHYSAGWNEEKREQIVEELMYRLTKKKDIDLLICMGTWAGQDFANDKHSIPTVVLSTSNPVLAEIVMSEDDSGLDHVVAPFDPNVYKRQLILFHEMVGFERLGIFYEDSLDGRSYAAINDVEVVAKERGFEIVKCYTESDTGDIQRDFESVKGCFEYLSGKVDAIYVTQQGGVTLSTIHELAEIAIQHKVPTFSQSGPEEVKYGLLASISQVDYDFHGEFAAETIGFILDGAIPRYLPQTFSQRPRVALNLRTAELIGFKPSMLLLAATDETYDVLYIPRK